MSQSHPPCWPGHSSEVLSPGGHRALSQTQKDEAFFSVSLGSLFGMMLLVLTALSRVGGGSRRMGEGSAQGMAWILERALLSSRRWIIFLYLCDFP